MLKPVLIIFKIPLFKPLVKGRSLPQHLCGIFLPELYVCTFQREPHTSIVYGILWSAQSSKLARSSQKIEHRIIAASGKNLILTTYFKLLSSQDYIQAQHSNQRNLDFRWDILDLRQKSLYFYWGHFLEFRRKFLIFSDRKTL